MYTHREGKRRVDVVDLDPYGTAAPFIDAAVQCVNDGGILDTSNVVVPVILMVKAQVYFA
jgi:tRNA G26 N,N-dimethylase Trm1